LGVSIKNTGQRIKYSRFRGCTVELDRGEDKPIQKMLEGGTAT
jgi:hypothetical protein